MCVVYFLHLYYNIANNHIQPTLILKMLINLLKGENL